MKVLSGIFSGLLIIGTVVGFALLFIWPWILFGVIFLYFLHPVGFWELLVAIIAMSIFSTLIDVIELLLLSSPRD